MESLISAIFAIYLLLFAGLTVYHTALDAQAEMVTAWTALDERQNDHQATSLTPVTATVTAGGSVVNLTLRNDGQTGLADFEEWDLLFHYYDTSGDYRLDWYPFTAGGPTLNEWALSGIYLDASTLVGEIYEPGILNPGEEMMLELQLSPSIGMTTTNMIVVGTNHGVNVSTFVER